jgi:hypothetical protein
MKRLIFQCLYETKKIRRNISSYFFSFVIKFQLSLIASSTLYCEFHDKIFLAFEGSQKDIAKSQALFSTILYFNFFPVIFIVILIISNTEVEIHVPILNTSNIQLKLLFSRYFKELTCASIKSRT